MLEDCDEKAHRRENGEEIMFLAKGSRAEANRKDKKSVKQHVGKGMHLLCILHRLMYPEEVFSHVLMINEVSSAVCYLLEG